MEPIHVSTSASQTWKGPWKRDDFSLTCAHRPSLKKLTAWLIKKHRDDILRQNENSSTANFEVMKNLEMLQLFTPFPIFMYLNDQELFDAMKAKQKLRNEQWLFRAAEPTWNRVYSISSGAKAHRCELAEH